jgi:hypothetical protein
MPDDLTKTIRETEEMLAIMRTQFRDVEKHLEYLRSLERAARREPRTFRKKPPESPRDPG